MTSLSELARRCEEGEGGDRQDVENMPEPGVSFLAENRHGDWMVARRFDSGKPRDYSGHAVINGRTGRWWYPRRWRHLPPALSPTTAEETRHD